MPVIQSIRANELNVIFEMSFHNSDHLVDEIEISSNTLYENKENFFKNNVIDSLKSANPGKKINHLQNADANKDGCIVSIVFDEKLNQKSPLASGLTFGIWPYIDTREITMKSKLTKNDKLISEANTNLKYKAVFSIFLIPLAPFKTIESTMKESWIDAYRENLSKIEFTKCD